MREINFFRTESGDCPIEHFLDSLSSKQAQKVVWVLQLVKDFARVPTQYFKKLINTDSVWEIRVQVGSNVFRILGFFETPTHFLATNGFQKKTQKTPQREINLSEKRKADYLKRRDKQYE